MTFFHFFAFFFLPRPEMIRQVHLYLFKYRGHRCRKIKSTSSKRALGKRIFIDEISTFGPVQTTTFDKKRHSSKPCHDFLAEKNEASFSAVKNKGVIYLLSLFYMGYAHRNRSKSNKIIKIIIKLRPAGRLSDNEFYRFFIDSDGSLRRRRINMADNKLF